MYFKKELIRYEDTLTLNSTYKFDELPETGLSAGLILTIASPVNSGEHHDPTRDDDKGRMIDWITKVQIITDGKRPLKDLSGPVAQALDYWNTGRAAPDYLRDRSMGEDRAFIAMPWGRNLFDPQYFLNWEDYGSIELDVTNVFTNPPYASASITIENLKIMDPPAGLASKGVFQERIWREWTTVQNETKYLKPPIGNKYRRIILRCVPDMATAYPYKRIRSFWHLAEEVKLAFKDYTEIAFDGYGEQLMEQNMLEFPHEAHTSGLSLAVATARPKRIVRTGIGRRIWSTATPSELGTDVTENNLGIYPYTDDLMIVFGDRATNDYIEWKAGGFGYNNTLALLFDHAGMEHLLDSVAKATINLDVKTENNADAAGGVNQVILSELVAK